MSKRTEHELQIRIGGKVDNSLTESVNEIKGELGSMGSTIKTVAAAAVTAFTSVKLKEAFDDVTDASKEMQTSMAGVAKVVDGLKDDNGKVTKSYNIMKDAILDMSKDLPMTAENIAAIMEAAGQSNIAKNELLEFTETATKMGIAFDSTAEQSGEWMAAWRTALKMNQKEVTDLADQVNYLGNTTSESAVKISEVITRVGSLAGTANVSAASVAAMAASMTKVESDVSATGIKNFTLALAAGDSATKRQHASFDKLGLKAKTVAKNMQMDSQGTIVDVLERINKLSKEEQTSTMKNLFGSESISAIAPMIANLDNLKEQFSKVGDAALYAGSMEKEYIAASSTYANVDVLTENKIQAMKVQVGDTLVSLSALAAETKGNLAESFGDFVQDHAPEIESTVRNIEKAFSEFLPTAVTNVKEFGKNAMDFIEPVYELIEDNPDLIPNFIVSTGAAMVTYKVGKNIGEIAKNVKAAGSPIKLLTGLITNPWALAIGATAGAIAMIATSVHNARKELREADLASRFGDITLSLEDLDEIAAGIIRNDNFGKLTESIKTTDTINSLRNSIDDTVADLKKFDWKVGIGLELSEDEQSSYKNSITNFISDSQNLLLEDRYKLNLNMDLFTDDSLKGKNIRDKMNSFYEEAYDTLINSGKELQEVVNEAFSDGLLTVDESKVISEHMQQIADMKRQMADAEQEAKLTSISMKYSGTNLTPESFGNLQAEVGEQNQKRIEEYTDELANTIQSYKIAYNAGGLSGDKYKEAVDMAKDNYLGYISESNLQSFDFQYQTIFDAYTDEIKSVLPEYKETLSKTVIKAMEEVKIDGNWGPALQSMYDAATNFEGIDKKDKANLSKLLKGLQPSKEQMEQTREQYIAAGKEVPKGILEGLQDIALLEALTGNADGIATTIGMQIASSPEYAKLAKTGYNRGVDLGEEVIDGIEYKMPDIKMSVDNIRKAMKETMEQDIKVNMPLDITVTSGRNKLLKELTTPVYKELFGRTGNLPVLPGYADGDIITSPTVATFAEEGPEAAIPLDGSQRSIDLWYMAGQIMGLFKRDAAYGNGFNIPEAYNSISNSSSSNNVINQPIFNFENTFNVESNADMQTVKNVVQQSQFQLRAEFEKFMTQYEKNKGRVNMKQ